MTEKMVTLEHLETRYKNTTLKLLYFKVDENFGLIRLNILSLQEQGRHSWFGRGLRGFKSRVLSPATSHPCFNCSPFFVDLTSFKYRYP